MPRPCQTGRGGAFCFAVFPLRCHQIRKGPKLDGGRLSRKDGYTDMLHHLGTETLYTPRLILRRFCLEDAAMMYEQWARDPAVTRYMTWDAHRSVADTRDILSAWVPQYAEPAYYNWAVVWQGTVIGGISVTVRKDAQNSCEVGYCLGKAYWNQGIMTEALTAVLDFLFGKVGYHRVSAVHDGANVASGRVMRKAGMREEGTLREAHLRRDGSYADIKCYAILYPEWKRRVLARG